jgi:biotin carboxyl carrier protein
LQAKPFDQMNLNRILTLVLLVASFYLSFRLYRGVQGTIEDREAIKTTEEAVIAKLKLIREAQVVFFEVNKRYTSNWDSLTNFIENGKVPNIQRREQITQVGYGQEIVKVFFDTLGFTPARERIFKKNFTLNSSESGQFIGFKVKVGDRVIKNQKAYSVKVGDKVQEVPFQEQGIITKLASVQPGNQLKKGDLLINFWDYAFDPSTDIKKISEVPGQEGKKFDIFVGKVDKNGVMVQVIEVKDPKPINPLRKESNEAKNRKPLHFGSKVDVTTSGNWESQ